MTNMRIVEFENGECRQKTHVDTRLPGPCRKVEEIHGDANGLSGLGRCALDGQKRMRIRSLEEILAELGGR